MVVPRTGFADAGYDRIEFRKESRKLRQQISILLCEAQFGFEGGEWTPAIFKQAIREYLLKFFRDFKRNHPEPKAWEFDRFRQHIDNAKIEVILLGDQFRGTYPKVAGVIDCVENWLRTVDLRPFVLELRSEEERGKIKGETFAILDGLPHTALNPMEFL
jgi:hypothetical protein